MWGGERVKERERERDVAGFCDFEDAFFDEEDLEESTPFWDFLEP